MTGVLTRGDLKEAAALIRGIGPRNLDLCALADRLEAEPEPLPPLSTAGLDRLMADERVQSLRVSREQALTLLVTARDQHSSAVVRERDEASAEMSEAQREAAVTLERALKAENHLRELIEAIDSPIGFTPERSRAALLGAKSFLEGVERTHALVPVEALDSLGRYLATRSGYDALPGSSWDPAGLSRWSSALLATAQGRHGVAWPS